MEWTTIGYIAIAALVGLIVLGVPLAFGIALVAIGGVIALFEPSRAAVLIYNNLVARGTDFILASVPLFIFMGQLVFQGNIGRDLYECVHKWFGRLPGGLAVTAVLTSTGFGAVTGVSAAAVATMAAISLPEMRRYNYNIRLAAGSIATASTLAILVPPSILMIIYGLWTEQNIGALFIAGIIPAIIMSALFCAYILIRCTLMPADGPLGPRYPWSERLASLVKLVPVILIFLIVMGGIYSGTFTPSEAAGAGSFVVLVLLLLMRRLTWRGFVKAVLDTARLSVMIFAIFVSVSVFTSFLVLTDVTGETVGWIADSGLGRYVVLLLIVIVYLIMGMMLDPIGMLLLSLPFVYPVIVHLGFDPIWFGVICTVLVEIALVTPPVGFNCYILKQVAGDDVSIVDIFAGTGPFVLLSLLVIVILTIAPGLATWLPAILL
ncbi:MAG: TRAP transporter large permease [Alphaproteobacteria bacterium]